jgi:hypothetical protein
MLYENQKFYLGVIRSRKGTSNLDTTFRVLVLEFRDSLRLNIVSYRLVASKDLETSNEHSSCCGIGESTNGHF